MLRTADYDVVSSNEVGGLISQLVISVKASSSVHYYCKGEHIAIYSRANNNWDYKGLEIFITHS